MQNYIFSLGIIPVQEFIAEARRTRDLKAGSVFLSWCMVKLLNYLRESPNLTDVEILLPFISEKEIEKKGNNSFKEAIESKGDVDSPAYSIPNRASGYFSAATKDAAAMFKNLDQFLIELWTEFSTDANEWIVSKDSSFANQYLSADCLPPVQIVWIYKAKDPATKREKNLENIDRLYSNIKRMRSITQWKGAPIAKCTQCGKREAIGPVIDIHNWRVWIKEFAKKNWVKKGYRIDENERLCQVCFLKRLAGYLDQGKTASTNEIACSEWLYRVEQVDDLKVLIREIETIKQPLDAFDQIKIKWFFDSDFRKMKNDDNQKVLENIKTKQTEISDKIKNRKNLGIASNPSDYLAVITFDGDNMGEHSRKEGVSKKIVTFAKRIRELFEEKRNGEIFYLGGDEGLMLCPIENIFKNAMEIQKIFSCSMGEQITISMGVTIFHRERPLGAAIRLAHQALQKSKSREGKSCLTFSVQTASGNVYETTEKWGEEWIRFENIFKLMQSSDNDYNARLSMGWAYEIEKFLLSLPNVEEEWSDSAFRKATKAEVKRITFRKLDLNNGNAQEKKTMKNRVWDEMFDMSVWMSKWISETYISDLSSRLHLLAFLIRESSIKNLDNIVMQEVNND